MSDEKFDSENFKLDARDVFADQLEALNYALNCARIDGARAFAEWLDANMDIDVLSFVEAVDRWLASDSKEG